jgi:hypothetical protein
MPTVERQILGAGYIVGVEPPLPASAEAMRAVRSLSLTEQATLLGLLESPEVAGDYLEERGYDRAAVLFLCEGTEFVSVPSEVVEAHPVQATGA